MFGRATRRARVVALAGVLAAGSVTAVVGATPAAADGPDVGAPWVVSVGDSAIPGEAGRWAGHTNDSSSKVDAGGADAYVASPAHNGARIPGDHPPTSAPVPPGSRVTPPPPA